MTIFALIINDNVDNSVRTDSHVIKKVDGSESKELYLFLKENQLFLNQSFFFLSFLPFYLFI